MRMMKIRVVIIFIIAQVVLAREHASRRSADMIAADRAVRCNRKPSLLSLVRRDLAAPTRRAGHVASRGGKSGLRNKPIFPQPLCLSKQTTQRRTQSSRKWSMPAPSGLFAARKTNSRISLKCFVDSHPPNQRTSDLHNEPLERSKVCKSSRKGAATS